MDGVVAEVMKDEGVIVETFGALVQGIFGVGGERTGKLTIPVDEVNTALTEDLITEAHAGAVIVAGSSVSLGAIKKAAAVGAHGVVVGAIIDTDLIEYLGHDIGVAITGHEDIPLTLIQLRGSATCKWLSGHSIC
jgi:uncharacterized membrane protein